MYCHIHKTQGCTSRGEASGAAGCPSSKATKPAVQSCGHSAVPVAMGSTGKADAASLSLIHTIQFHSHVVDVAQAFLRGRGQPFRKFCVHMEAALTWRAVSKLWLPVARLAFYALQMDPILCPTINNARAFGMAPNVSVGLLW